MNMFIKQWIVSTTSLAHDQATVIQESEYIIETKYHWAGDISFYIKAH